MVTCLEDITNIFYINLDHRVDRKDHVELQLSKIGFSSFNRFSAIKMENGAIGCSMSHLKLLQHALKSGLDYVLIVEDDIEFLDPELFKMQLNRFFKAQQKTGFLWDVILFAGNNMPPYETIDDTCVKISHCQTTTGYLVNGHYIEKLMNNVKTGLTNLLRNPEKRLLYAIDMYWLSLQKSDQWFLITPLTVVQRDDYSDIEKKVVHYHKAMTDLDKVEIMKKMKANEEYNLEKQKYEEMMAKFRSRMNLS
jgi:glycosyl transferase family 25